MGSDNVLVKVTIIFFFLLLLAFPSSPFVLFRPFCPLYSFPTSYLNRFLPTLRSAKSRSGSSRAFNYGIRSGPGAVYLGTFLFLFLCVESSLFLQTLKAALWLGFVSCDRYAAAVRPVGILPEYLCHRNRKRTVHAAYRRTVRSPSALHCCSPSPPFPNKNRTPMCTEGLPHFPPCERAFLD